MIVMAGCSETYDVHPKLSSIDPIVESSIEERSTELSVDPSNPNNPVDSIGEIHNELLDAIAFNEGFDTLDIMDFLFEYVVEEKGWEVDEKLSNSSADSMVNVIWEYCIEVDLEEDFTGLIDEFSTAFAYSQTLTNHLESLFSLLDYAREDVPISDLIDSIIVKEDLFSTAVVTASESLIFYGTASILRYSAAYWEAVIEDESSSHPFYTVVVSHLMDLDENINSDDIVDVRKWNWKKFWRGLAVIGADALGFAGGYAFGSSLSGGLPAAGIAAGTLIGGATSGMVRDAWEP